MAMIELRGVGLTFGQKTCFSGVDARIEWGQRIAIVGDNGNGKSSLLRLLHGSLAPSEGEVQFNAGLRIGYVAQVLDGDSPLSGGQRVNQAISQALANDPDLLLLDEPTNHLDIDNRRSLSRMLQNFYGTLVLVTHDLTLMNQTCDTLWHIGHGRLEVFNGTYADYRAEQALQRESLEKQIGSLKRAREDAHQALMQEQERAAGARKRGVKAIQNSKWATIRSPTKLGRGNTTAGRKQAQILEQQRELTDQLAQQRPVQVIVPRFNLPAASQTRRTLVQISQGSIGYGDATLLEGIDLHLAQGERLALAGPNGSGKSTLARAIMGDEQIWRLGEWVTPPPEQVGYVDQHYSTLAPGLTVLAALASVVPEWTVEQQRSHLADFLFRQGSTVQTRVAQLSGGEKARLSLACIAARPPQLLILDELTNNLDLRMREHVLEVLTDYPNAMLVISHDEDFLAQLALDGTYECRPPVRL
ncbi:ABC-F family ATP-binding cassette domain-containing protein [Pseudomonas fontis]|uniref:ATP-binding cassette domain-containing protein n=1 Tax=Pseudomonas fontis TaxID=2942633 RepID=A0ABT5NY18_9PSED|nr:ABC-F family ATP-binding cassette domain-containing protein [Pseudomonas fontis]MDD0972523.1 ATP-binding cassette domain-containing protein [Pseudomonas fontis]MDD0993047.1 ATP-binding cassette domain-containing protein [Pseudomonas fontis]